MGGGFRSARVASDTKSLQVKGDCINAKTINDEEKSQKSERSWRVKRPSTPYLSNLTLKKFARRPVGNIQDSPVLFSSTTGFDQSCSVETPMTTTMKSL